MKKKKKTVAVSAWKRSARETPPRLPNGKKEKKTVTTQLSLALRGLAPPSPLRSLSDIRFCFSFFLFISGHRYHLQCIMQWHQRNPSCPMCFRRLELEDKDAQSLLDCLSGKFPLPLLFLFRIPTSFLIIFLLTLFFSFFPSPLL